MPISKPRYFDKIARAARSRWNQLKADPQLAGPWYQLFKQLRGQPRYLLSELLQNADDAGATWARVSLAADTFTFEHDGRDFTENDFDSLCQFAFSNKRSLHTIGFRGIGFKTVFSIGQRVELLTPTLAVAFDADRFTEPIWLEGRENPNCTRVVVQIDAPEKVPAVQATLNSWVASTVPLLFFRNIQRLVIQGQAITKATRPSSLVANCESVDLLSSERHSVMLVTSEEEAFPPDAIAEVRAERGDEGFDLPPCRVQLVLGRPGEQRVYVVLPTGVITNLPFSFNAPFLQDPARTGVKSPSVSPTNRWLLQRVGRLAADTLWGWLDNQSLDLAVRAEAYLRLLPDPPAAARDDIADECAGYVLQAFRQGIVQSPILLTSDGHLETADGCLDLPAELLECWTVQQNLELFGGRQRAVLAPEVEEDTRDTLAGWEWLNRVDERAILDHLTRPPYPPRPSSAAALMALWSLLERYVPEQRWRYYNKEMLAIIPVRGRDRLCPAQSVTLMPSGRSDLSQEDWAFLADYIPVADPDWIRLLQGADKLAAVDSPENAEDGSRVAEAGQLYMRLNLGQHSSLARAVDQAASRIFKKGENPGEAGIQLAYVAAHADVRVPDGFMYRCDDGAWRPVTEGLLADVDTALEYLPLELASTRLIHPAYTQAKAQRDRAIWRRWVGSANSRLRRFPLPKAQTHFETWRVTLERLVSQRGGQPGSYPFSRERYFVSDYDFDGDLWRAWEGMAAEEPDVWSQLVRGICRDWSTEWKQASKLGLCQISKANSTASLSWGDPAAAWLHRLRGLTCLPDRHGQPHVPTEICRATAETSHLVDVEPFLAPAFDRPEYAEFLDLLGVRSKPEGVEPLLRRIRAFSGVSSAPRQPVFDLYRALDRSAPYLSQDKGAALREAFATEKLVLADDGEWYLSHSVFQTNPEGLPDIPAVPADVAGLGLWTRLELPPQPTIDHLIEWAKHLPRGQQVSDTDARRVRSLLARAPQRVWEELGYWLDPARCWTEADGLTWRSAVPEQVVGLFQGIKNRIADVSMLPLELIEQPPFATLTDLTRELEYRPVSIELSSPPETKDWLQALAGALLRISPLDNGSTGAEVDPAGHLAAQRLYHTLWQPVSTLRVQPYLQDQPCGEHSVPSVLWQGTLLYVRRDGAGGYRQLVEAISSPFKDPLIRRAISACAERSLDWISAYFESEFQLGPEDPDAISRLLTDTGPNAPTRSPGSGSTLSIEEDESGDAPSDNGLPYDEEIPEDVPFDGDGGTSGPPKRRARRQLQHLAHYFARFGFVWDQERKAFIGSQGMIRYEPESHFPWRQEQRGDVIQHYWVGYSSLEQGIVVPSEIWERLKTIPESVTILLPDQEGELVGYLGTALCLQVTSGAVQLFSASYRLLRARDELVP